MASPEGEEEELEQQPVPARVGLSGGYLACILLVEDDPLIRDAVELALSLAGHSVVTASDGVQALERASAQRPRLIILDLGLPVMDGRVFLERYAQTIGERAPVLVFSAAVDLERFPEAWGVRGMVEKTIDVHRFLKLVEEHARPSS